MNTTAPTTSPTPARLRQGALDGAALRVLDARCVHEGDPSRWSFETNAGAVMLEHDPYGGSLKITLPDGDVIDRKKIPRADDLRPDNLDTRGLGSSLPRRADWFVAFEEATSKGLIARAFWVAVRAANQQQEG